LAISLLVNGDFSGRSWLFGVVGAEVLFILQAGGFVGFDTGTKCSAAFGTINYSEHVCVWRFSFFQKLGEFSIRIGFGFSFVVFSLFSFVIVMHDFLLFSSIIVR